MTKTPTKKPSRKLKTSFWQTLKSTSFRNKIAFVVFLVAWIYVVMNLCQIIWFTVLFNWLNLSMGRPFHVMIYYALYYATASALIILMPPHLFNAIQKMQHHKLNSTAKAASKELAVNVNELGVHAAPTLVDVGLAPIGYLLYVIIAEIFTEIILNLFPGFNVNEDQNIGFTYFSDYFARFCGLVSVVIIAPIAEELIMRGWLYGKLRNRTKTITAIIVTSILFAFLHGQWNVAIITFVLSVILCLLREITGTIWCGILLHMIVNGIAFYVRYNIASGF